MQVNGGSTSTVPLKPVDIKDKHGLKAGIYAVNAARKRLGQAEIDEGTIASAVQNRVVNANWEKLGFLMREWNGSRIPKDNEGLIKLFKENSSTRYQVGIVINDIELGSLATIFNVCIAVKTISSDEGEGSPGWRIAVPTPAVFGVPSKSVAAIGDPSCVFLVCQKISNQSRFIVLLPKDQPVFAPGRLLIVSENRIAAKEKDQFNFSNLKHGDITHPNQISVEDASSNKENKDISTIVKIAESTGNGKEFVPLPKNGRIELRIGDVSEATILFQRVYGQPNLEIVNC